MTRRAQALVLLLIAVAACASQGLSMALCRCTGHVFVGAAPESCCGECPDDEAVRPAALAAMQSMSPSVHGEGCMMLTSREDCFVVVSNGWETYLPANGKDQAPALVLAVVEPLATLLLTPAMPRHVPQGWLSWNAMHQPEPPGPSRVVLYHSLLI